MLRVGLTGGLGSGKSTAARMFAAHGAHLLSADRIGQELMQRGQAVYAAIVARFGPSVVAADGALDRAALARLAFGNSQAGGGRVEELNAIVHPAVIARQQEMIDRIAARDADAVAMVESALIFETKYEETKYEETKYGETKYEETKDEETKDGETRREETKCAETSHDHTGHEQISPGDWGGPRSRFDRIILVRAPLELKIARFVARGLVGNTPDEEQLRALEAEARRRIAMQIDDDRKAAGSDYLLTNDGPIEQLQAQVDALWPVLKAAARHRA